MRVAWATDIHLNFLNAAARQEFYQSIAECDPHAVFITGDIAEAPTVSASLVELADALTIPIYFVLGNHDFYYDSIPDVRARVHTLCATHPYLHYLTGAAPLRLTESTAIVGHDGWGDARYGNVFQTPVRLSDNQLIKDFADLEYRELIPALRRQGDEAATELLGPLTQATDQAPQIIVLTHVPPTREACWYEGEPGSPDWLPFFTCKAVGDLLVESMEQRTDCGATVYCGHTHHSGEVQALPNLRIVTGAAEYGAPRVHAIIDVA